MQDSTSIWFAVQVKPRHEKQVARAIEAKDTEYFLPLKAVRSRWADRWKRVDLPLFPGYVFARIDHSRPSLILRTPGVVGIVKNGSSYAPVDAEELRLLRMAVDAGLDLEPSDLLKNGTTVDIIAGPLRGAEGVVVGYKNSLRLVLSVTLLRRSVLAEVDLAWIATKQGNDNAVPITAF